MLSCTSTIIFNEYYDFYYETWKCFTAVSLLTLYPNVIEKNPFAFDLLWDIWNLALYMIILRQW